jgi:hypothetical protein
MQQRFDFVELIDRVTACAARHGILVSSRPFPLGKAAEFDGQSVVLNSQHDEQSRGFYLVHSLGSIVGWSLDVEGVRALFDELRDAKHVRTAEPAHLESAVQRFRQFEEGASEYSVQILQDVDCAWAIASFSLFFRADLEAMTIFHRTGRAPVWPDFLAQWKEDVATGRRVLELFTPREIPPFAPRPFPKQEVMQERG